MSRRILSLAIPGFLLVIIFNWSCTKLDTTNIGSDLLPTVDNINTFADTLDIISTQGEFLNDSTTLSVTNVVEGYAVGKMNDPLFGGTDARLFVQLKPGFYPYYIGIAKDTILHQDSAVLCLSFVSAYGDTTQPIQLQVHEVAFNQHGEWDSLGTYDKPNLRPVRYAPAIGNPLSDPVTIDLASVRTYHKIGKGKDSVINQIRIKLYDTFMQNIFEQDSLPGNTPPHGFGRDSLFRAFVSNGFAISMTQGNALLYTYLNDANTRLELHYQKTNAGVRDTAMTTFTFNNGAGGSAAPRRSAVANNIVRTRPALGTGDQEIYLQSAPGTYANLKIPELTGYANKIIHRAELIFEQIPDNAVTDGYFSEPKYLYLDLLDTGATNRWKPVYFDLNPSVYYNPDSKTGSFDYYPYTGEVDFSYFGGKPITKTDGTGRKYYTVNISRYLQQLVTKQTPNYDFRLFAPHEFSYPQYETSPTKIPYINTIGWGRIKLGGGNNPNPAYRMRLRVIFSKVSS